MARKPLLSPKSSPRGKWCAWNMMMTQRRDRYRRLLVYVYLPDGTFLNAEIIKQGYGFAYTRFPFKYMEQFRQYERSARESGAGLWAK